MCYTYLRLQSTPAFSARCSHLRLTLVSGRTTATAPAWGLSPLQDQQLGGLIMWVPAGLVYIATGLALFARWLRRANRWFCGARVRISVAFVLACFGALALAGCGSNSSARSAESAMGGDPVHGAAAITHYGCGSCHTIRGISGANALVGPPLTGFASRNYVAGMLSQYASKT